MTIKNIRLGDYSGYDRTSQSVIPIQDAEVNYTAVINTSGYNMDTQNVDNIDHPLTVGVNNNINLLTTNTLKLTANNGFKFDGFSLWQGGAEPISLPQTVIEYELTDAEMEHYSGIVGFIVTTEVGASTPQPLPTTNKTIRLGNAKVYNRETQVVELVQNVPIEYTAELYTKQYNPSTQLFEEHTYPLTVGVDNVVGVLSEIVLRLRSNSGKRINQFTLGYDESNPIVMPKNDIDYTFNPDLVEIGTAEFIVTTEGGGIIPPEPDRVNVENNYLTTPEEYTAFKNELYSIVAGEGMSGEGLNPAKYPTSTYVTSTKLYPFKIPANELGESVKIIAKESVMTSKGKAIKGNVITLDIGDIVINRVHNNALDYLNVTGELFLPFYSGSVDLDINLMMGKTINVKYEIIVNSGDTTINISDKATGTVLNVLKTTVGGDFPLFNAVEQDELVFTPQQAINSVRTAYVILSVPDYSQGLPKSVKTGVLTGVTGDVSATDVKLESNAYADEKLMIENILSQGITIK